MMTKPSRRTHRLARLLGYRTAALPMKCQAQRLGALAERRFWADKEAEVDPQRQFNVWASQKPMMIAPLEWRWVSETIAVGDWQ
jgi:hypothetical protein